MKYTIEIAGVISPVIDDITPQNAIAGFLRDTDFSDKIDCCLRSINSINFIMNMNLWLQHE